MFMKNVTCDIDLLVGFCLFVKKKGLLISFFFFFCLRRKRILKLICEILKTRLYKV